MDYRDVPAEEMDRSVISPFGADRLKQKYCRTFVFIVEGKSELASRQSRSSAGLCIIAGHHEVNVPIDY